MRQGVRRKRRKKRQRKKDKKFQKAIDAQKFLLAAVEQGALESTMDDHLPTELAPAADLTLPQQASSSPAGPLPASARTPAVPGRKKALPKPKPKVAPAANAGALTPAPVVDGLGISSNELLGAEALQAFVAAAPQIDLNAKRRPKRLKAMAECGGQQLEFSMSCKTTLAQVAEMYAKWTNTMSTGTLAGDVA